MSHRRSRDMENGTSPLARPLRFPISPSVISGILVVIDFLVIVGTGTVLYFQLVSATGENFDIYLATACAIWVTILMLFQFSELFQFEAIVRPLANIDKIVLSFATGFLLLLAAAFSFKVTSVFSGTWLATYGIAAFALTVAARLAFSRGVLFLARLGFLARNVIIVGKKAYVARLLKRIAEIRPDIIIVAGIFVDGATGAFLGNKPVLGGPGDVPAFVRTSHVDDVIIAMPWSAEEAILTLAGQLRQLPVNVYLGSDLIGLRMDFREPPGHFQGTPVFSIIGRPLSGWTTAVKTIEDYLLGAACLLVFALPMALIALCVRLDSPGPVLFRQKRFGFNNQAFSIYKFRTMRHQIEPAGKTVQATSNDPRITNVGRFLRRSSLDELPQLFNVMNGTMSLVGPRPHAVDQTEEYAEKISFYFARHRVKPGITGWAQVNGLRGETDTPQKMEARVRFDIYYAENWSLALDLRILLQTTIVLVTGRNAH